MTSSWIAIQYGRCVPGQPTTAHRLPCLSCALRPRIRQRPSSASLAAELTRQSARLQHPRSGHLGHRNDVASAAVPLQRALLTLLSRCRCSSTVRSLAMPVSAASECTIGLLDCALMRSAPSHCRKRCRLSFKGKGSDISIRQAGPRKACKGQHLGNSI